MSMHREDFEGWFVTAKTWAGSHTTLVLLAATFVVAFILGAYSCSGK